MVSRVLHLKTFSFPFFAVSHKRCSFFSPSGTARFFSTQALSYGPSLNKGRNPRQSLPLSPTTVQHEDNLIDEDTFTRVFDIAALRVPAKDCYPLERRLRGHLLNWPRVRNIARVPGDEVDPEIVGLLAPRGKNAVVVDGGKADDDDSLVLYRERLVKEFNYRGFVKFKNLAKISRPPKKRTKKEAKVQERKKEYERRASSLVEVVGLAGGGGEMKGLLGEGFERQPKWGGSTRLLLLDETYANKGVGELPPAVKAVFVEFTKEDSVATIELVKCRLTLYYDYWPMNEILEFLLPKGVTIPSAFETVGHIAHLNLKDEHLPFKKVIAKVVLDKNSPQVQTVVNKTDAISNEYRTMQLEVLAGNHSLVTTVVENGLRFLVDLATVYWNSRLATERKRLLDGFNNNDIICDVFSGVGPIAISAAKVVKRVYANDLNPCAVDYLERNSVLNKLEKKIQVFNMDGRRFIKAMFSGEKAHSITQVVMNLPSNAVDFLDAFRGIYIGARPSAVEINLPRIHVYGFSKAEDPEFDFHERVRIALREVAVDVEMRRVRLVAPGKWMLCASFNLPRKVAYAKNLD